jgi:hypothetical protein
MFGERVTDREKKTCGTCGKIIEDGLFVESEGIFYHEQCWDQSRREKIAQLAQPKITTLLEEISSHWSVLKKFVAFSVAIVTIFIVELAFYEANNLFLVILTVGTFCIVLSCPVMVIYLLVIIRKKRKEAFRLSSGLL